jgi:hypothetical protein
MPNTLIPIQTYTLTSSSTSILFSNIPQNYTDLKLVVSARATTGESFGQLKIYPNGSTSSNTRRNLGTFGSASVASYSDTDKMVGYVNGDSSTASTFSSTEIYFTNYASSNYKPYSSETIVENNSASVFSTTLYSSLWSSTSAITSLQIVVVNSAQTVCNILSGSTFTLYGISNGVKATGGTLTVAGGYAYHTFTSTGSFLPNQRIKNAEILAVAGGGGGGAGQGGGGGAGGVLYAAAQTFNAGQSYTALVGAGGAGGTRSTVSNGKRGSNGNNSVISSQSASAGGGGGNYDENVNGLSGGSGGGAGASSVSGTGGTATSGQGFAGGNNGTYSPPYSGGGGGGAGGAGSNGGTATGNGGPGTSTYSSWHSITSTGVLSSGLYYIAGGGAGAGETSTASGGIGGGASSSSSTPTAATANTGGGGGATTYNGSYPSAGAGGSGLIIVRYPIS